MSFILFVVLECNWNSANFVRIFRLKKQKNSRIFENGTNGNFYLMANGRHQICDECAIDKCRMKKKFGNSIVCAVRYKVRGTVVHTSHNMTSYHRWIPSEWHICQTLEYCSSWAHSCLSKAVALCELDHNSLSRFIVNFKRLDASAFVCERVCARRQTKNWITIYSKKSFEF